MKDQEKVRISLESLVFTDFRWISYEIHQISPGRFHVKSWDIAFPMYSMKLKSFSSIIWIRRFSGGFHEIHNEIHQISWNPHVESAGFHKIHMWNPPNFMKSVNMSFCVITKYRSFFRKTNKLELKINSLRPHIPLFGTQMLIFSRSLGFLSIFTIPRARSMQRQTVNGK